MKIDTLIAKPSQTWRSKKEGQMKIDTLIFLTAGIRFFVKFLGVYLIFYLNIPAQRAILSVLAIIVTELYEIPASLMVRKNFSSRHLVYSFVGTLNALVILGLLSYNNLIGSDLYLILMVAAVGTSVIGGLIPSFVFGLVSAIFYSLFTLPILDNFSLAMRSFFIFITSILAGILGELYLRSEEEKAALLEKLTQKSEINRIKNEFIVLTSHYLRTPLTVIEGWLEGISKAKDIKEASRGIKEAQEAAFQLGSMIENLLNVAALELRQPALTLALTDLNELIEGVLLRFQDQVSQKNLKVNFFDKRKSVGKINVDAARIQKALFNVIDNSVKFTPNGGSIKLFLEEDPAFLIITVKDTGTGIEREELENIFQKFHKTTDPLRFTEGLGMGLYETRLIVEAHEGKINIESEKGKGTAVRIYLPVSTLKEVLIK